MVTENERVVALRGPVRGQDLPGPAGVREEEGPGAPASGDGDRVPLRADRRAAGGAAAAVVASAVGLLVRSKHKGMRQAMRARCMPRPKPLRRTK